MKSVVISNILIHKCLIASPNLCQIVAPNGFLGSFCTKSIIEINLHKKSAQKMCAKNVRQILFESLFCAEDLSEIHPQIHPGKNVQADENIEIFVAPSASCVCIQHLLSFQLKCSSNIDSIHYLRLTNSFDKVPRDIHTLPSIIVNFLLNSLNAPITFVVCATNQS
jgi:hypothetical protein